MSKEKKVKITILKVPEIGELFEIPLKLNFSGPCPFYKVGQEFIVEDEEKPEGFCVFAWDVFWPYIMTLRRGGDFIDFYKESGKVFLCCPDAARPISVLIERV